jgi:hypothetical protein
MLDRNMDWSKSIEDARPCSWRVRLWRFQPLRFLCSCHTRDLVAIAGLSGVVALSFASLWICSSSDRPNLDAHKLEAAVIAGALAVIAWAYQAGNVRLGVVDLLASEIFTLCKVAFVGRLVPRLVEWEQTQKAPTYPLVPQQDYMVVFNTNTKDLEVLDGDVVNFVTAAYVYCKLFRDRIAILYSASRQNNASHCLDANAAVPDMRTDGQQSLREPNALLDTVFMAFVTFESAREALRVAVDDPDRRDECVLFGLISELEAYSRLIIACAKFEFECPIVRARIRARLPIYETLRGQIADQPCHWPNCFGGKQLRERVTSLLNESLDATKYQTA